MVIWSTEQVDLSSQSQSYFISDSSNKTRSPDTDIHYGLKRITTWNMTVTRSWERNQISLVNFVVSCSLWSFLKVPRVAAIWTSRVTPAESGTWYSAAPVTAHLEEGHGGIASPANRTRTMRREGKKRSFKWCKEVRLCFEILRLKSKSWTPTLAR